VSETFADVTDPARRTPRGWRRFVYLALGESTVWSHLFGWKKTHAVTSAPLLPLLAAEAQDPTLSPALLAGAVGQAEKSRRLHHPSFLGVAGVSASHVMSMRFLDLESSYFVDSESWDFVDAESPRFLDGESTEFLYWC